MCLGLTACHTTNINTTTNIYCGGCNNKNIIPPTRADSIRAKFFEVDTSRIIFDDAESQHQKNKAYTSRR